MAESSIPVWGSMGPLREINTLVTNEDAGSKFIQAFESLDIEVVQAAPL